MKVSKEMDMIRKIRDENSHRRLTQSKEEWKKELNESTKWFFEEMNKLNAEDARISKIG
jgi:hypothetical protein